MSTDTAKLIEDEIKRFVVEGFDRAKKILTDRREEWEKLSQALLEYETLTGEEIAALLRGGKSSAKIRPTAMKRRRLPRCRQAAGGRAWRRRRHGAKSARRVTAGRPNAAQMQQRPDQLPVNAPGVFISESVASKGVRRYTGLQQTPPII
ncbi:MAG: hypothetical protein R3C40_06515 [Parvularculaceae bacterium]